MKNNKLDLIKVAVDESKLNTNKASNRYLFFLVLSIFLGLGWLSYTIYTINQTKQNLNDITILKNEKDSLIQQIRLIAESDSIEQSSKDSIIVNTIHKAKISEIDNKLKRQKFTIQYFPKNVDDNKVKNALKGLSIPLLTGTPKFPNGETNAIYKGTNIDNETVKLILQILYENGIEIKGIFNFNNSKGRENLIQIVHSKKINNSTIKEVEELVGFKLK